MARAPEEMRQSCASENSVSWIECGLVVLCTGLRACKLTGARLGHRKECSSRVRSTWPFQPPWSLAIQGRPEGLQTQWFRSGHWPVRFWNAMVCFPGQQSVPREKGPPVRRHLTWPPDSTAADCQAAPLGPVLVRSHGTGVLYRVGPMQDQILQTGNPTAPCCTHRERAKFRGGRTVPLAQCAAEAASNHNKLYRANPFPIAPMCFWQVQ